MNKNKEQFLGIPNSKESGIYMIYNIYKHKAYIGQTHNFRNRALSHKRNLKSGTHSNRQLQKDYNDGDNFIFSIIHITKSETDLRILESEYIYAFQRRYVKLYNCETKEQIENFLFYDLVLPQIKIIEENLREKFKCPLPTLEYCKPITLIEKLKPNSWK